MKKRILFAVILSMLLGSCNACGDTKTIETGQSVETEETSESGEPQDEGSESEEPSGDEVLPEPEEPTPQTAQFWIDRTKDADKVILSYAQIDACNQKILSVWGTGWSSGYYDVASFSEEVDGAALKERIDLFQVRKNKLYCRGERITEEQWDRYYANYNFDGIPEKKKTAFGVITTNVSALDIPTDDIITGSDLDEDFCSIQETHLKVNEPVVILHESADGLWYFVAANEFIGWVKKACCAVFPSRQEWLEYQKNYRFVMVVQDQVLEDSGKKLLMGTKLFLSDRSGENGADRYCVRMPKPDAKGFVSFEDVEIPKEIAHRGYLPFTRENVAILAFRELGEPYGWGGQNGKRDCSMYIKDIFACFGFRFPRNSRLQQSMPGLATSINKLTVAQKKEVLDGASLGDIVGFSGHIMMYLGKNEEDGKHYVISMLSSYVPEEVTENFADAVEHPSCVFVNPLDVKRKSGKTWISELRGAVFFGKEED